MFAKRCIVTGGAGFIGSALVRRLIEHSAAEVLVVDALTYAGDLAKLEGAASSERCRFLKADICDFAAMERAFCEFCPDTVFNLAAETHVDRSIENPGIFVETNVLGTERLLEAALAYLQKSSPERRKTFVFHQISTDEVYGSLGAEGVFSEASACRARSPYSASKAAADALVTAWHETFGMRVVVTRSANNYGPHQHREKLIPKTVENALSGRKIPIYGDGSNVRDWIHVDDHATALVAVNESGRAGEIYNVGAGEEHTNIDVVRRICGILDKIRPRRAGKRYEELVEFVADRPGHDLRYALDTAKIRRETAWRPSHDFDTALAETVEWLCETWKRNFLKN